MEQKPIYLVKAPYCQNVKMCSPTHFKNKMEVKCARGPTQQWVYMDLARRDCPFSVANLTDRFTGNRSGEKVKFSRSRDLVVQTVL